MKKLLFEPNVKGHRMEFINHLYKGMISHPETEYTVLVPEAFKERQQMYEWPEAAHIQIAYFKESEIDPLNSKNYMRRAYIEAILLRKYIKQLKPEEVFLISIMGYQLFAPLYWFLGAKLTGIIYTIYLYRWKKMSFTRRCSEVLKYVLLSKQPMFKRIFILNDSSAVSFLNRKYHTSKFEHLIDPYNQTGYEAKDIRAELGISKQEIMYIHFGGLQGRKGTMNIMKAIEAMSEDECNGKCFVFAGKVYDDIRDTLYEKYKQMKPNKHLIMKDEFCTNEFFSDLCYSADCILVPYVNTANSSGVIGYGAYYKKTVIGPDSGLIGKLIRKNRLGYIIKCTDIELLKEAIMKFEPSITESKYCEKNTIQNFIKTIFDR